MSAQPDWGLPDWRVASAYPEVDRTPITAWWWEFLRRRDDYREHWLEAECDEDPEGNRFPKDKVRPLLEFSTNMLLDPARPYSEHEHLSAHFSRPTGLWSPLSKVEADALKYARSIAAINQGAWLDNRIADAEARASAAENAGITTFGFDLTKPILPQLARAAEVLGAAQEYRFAKLNTRKLQPEKWALYLRALDARADGASWSEMAGEFWPGLSKSPQSARDTYRLACALRDNFPV